MAGQRGSTLALLSLGLVLFLPGLPTPVGAQRDLRLDRQEQSGERFALVVGNDSYPDAPLGNARNDARAISRVLGELGFQVTFLEDLGHDAFGRAVARFSDALSPNDIALFYFAGHGLQVEGENFLIPTDFKGNSLAAVRLGGIRVGDIEQLLGRSRVGMLILDACRNNPFAGTRGIGRGLAPMEATGTFIAFATGAGQTAEDGQAGSNGLFTAELLRVLQLPDLTVQQVFQRVRRNVYAATGGRQVPAVYDGLLGDFVFRASAPAAAATVQPTNLDSPGANETHRPSALADAMSQSPPATLFVYRRVCMNCSVKNPTVVCDDVALAQLNKGYFFQAALPPGLHTCKTTGSGVSAKEIQITLEAGKQQFVKFSQGMFADSARLEQVAPAAAVTEIQRLKPIALDKIKDTKRVAAAPATPARQ